MSEPKKKNNEAQNPGEFDDTQLESMLYVAAVLHFIFVRKTNALKPGQLMREMGSQMHFQGTKQVF
jgi:hypothetical protein